MTVMSLIFFTQEPGLFHRTPRMFRQSFIEFPSKFQLLCIPESTCDSIVWCLDSSPLWEIRQLGVLRTMRHKILSALLWSDIYRSANSKAGPLTAIPRPGCSRCVPRFFCAEKMMSCRFSKRLGGADCRTLSIYIWSNARHQYCQYSASTRSNRPAWPQLSWRHPCKEIEPSK